MGLGDWAKKHLAIRLDSHTLGNLVKNAAPVAGTVVGGPLGLGLAGALGAAGEAGRGKTGISDLLKAGVSGAAQAGIGQAGRGLLASRFGGAAVPTGPTAAPVSSAANAGEAAADTVPTGGLSLATTPDLTTSAVKAVDPRSFLDKTLDAGKGVLNFAESHPSATSGALQGLGNLATSGAQNRYRDAETANLESRTDLTQYELDQLKRRQQQYAPVWGALSAGPTTGGYAGVSKNPYASAGA